jgi:hypothetical protein
MIRVAVTGLVTDALWHALQAPGWTEDQLKTLRTELARVDLFGVLPRVYERERIVVLQDLDDYRKRGLSHLRTVRQRYGLSGANGVAWKQRLHYEHWRFFRCRDVELQVIQDLQRLIEQGRRLAQGRPVSALRNDSAEDKRSGFQKWIDKWGGPGRQFSYVAGYAQPPAFDLTLILVTQCEAYRRLALAALGLEQFRLATGALPSTLEELVPEYLDAVPRDLVDGKPMHYEPGPQGDFTLSFRDADGIVRRLRDDPLLWPVAESPWPLPEPNLRRYEVLPLVSFTDAPLIDVIKTLARQAEIDLIFDPRILDREYPPVSLHVMQVTAYDVLERLLRHNGLRLRRDPRTHIYRVTH